MYAYTQRYPDLKMPITSLRFTPQRGLENSAPPIILIIKKIQGIGYFNSENKIRRGKKEGARERSSRAPKNSEGRKLKLGRPSFQGVRERFPKRLPPGRRPRPKVGVRGCCFAILFLSHSRWALSVPLPALGPSAFTKMVTTCTSIRYLF